MQLINSNNTMSDAILFSKVFAPIVSVFAKRIIEQFNLDAHTSEDEISQMFFQCMTDDQPIVKANPVSTVKAEPKAIPSARNSDKPVCSWPECPTRCMKPDNNINGVFYCSKHFLKASKGVKPEVTCTVAQVAVVEEKPKVAARNADKPLCSWTECPTRCMKPDNNINGLFYCSKHFLKASRGIKPEAPVAAAPAKPSAPVERQSNKPLCCFTDCPVHVMKTERTIEGKVYCSVHYKKMSKTVAEKPVEQPKVEEAKVEEIKPVIVEQPKVEEAKVDVVPEEEFLEFEEDYEDEEEYEDEYDEEYEDEDEINLDA